MPPGSDNTGLVNVVCPPVEDLLSENTGKYTCSLCGKVISNSSALNLHLVKAHRTGDVERYEKGGSTVKVKTVYCCPAIGCPRGARNRPFRNIWHVKQHYLNCHAERQHQCPQCKTKFGTINRLKQHQKNCGRTFTCSCGCPFTSREALLTHARIQGHSHELDVSQKGSPQVLNREKSASIRNTTKKVPENLNARTKQLVAVPMVLLLRKDDLPRADKPRTLLPEKPITTRGHVLFKTLPNLAASTIGTAKKDNICQVSESARCNGEPHAKKQHVKDNATSELQIFTEKNLLEASNTESNNVELMPTGNGYDVSDAFTQTKEQTYGNQVSQTGLSYSDLAENQTQTVSLEDLLDYQLNDAFTQTCTVEGIASQCDQSRLSEIETQTTEIIDLLQENVSDAFTQTLQRGISDQCSQTNNSLFNMITGTTQTKSLSALQGGYQNLTSVQSCSNSDYDIFATNGTPSFTSNTNSQSYSSHTVFADSVSAMESDFTENTDYSSDDLLNDAFTQTWSQCSIDQFSQTNWSDYIERSFLETADVNFTPANATSAVNNSGECISRKPTPDATGPYNSCTGDNNESLGNRLCSSVLDSCTQTTLTFNTMIDLAFEEDNREMLTPSPYLTDAGTQTPIPVNSPFH